MKIDTTEFYEIKLAAMINENAQLQEELIRANDNVSKLLAENCALKKHALDGKMKSHGQRFDELVQGLKKYGENITLEDVDWLTGEIKGGAESKHSEPTGISSPS